MSSSKAPAATDIAADIKTRITEIDQQRTEIDRRRAEMDKERNALTKALDALTRAATVTTITAPARSVPKRGRPKGTGKRDKQVLKALTKYGPMTTADLARAMGVKPNYLYVLAPRMERDGRIVKRDGRWHVA